MLLPVLNVDFMGSFDGDLRGSGDSVSASTLPVFTSIQHPLSKLTPFSLQRLDLDDWVLVYKKGDPTPTVHLVVSVKTALKDTHNSSIF
jgi:hypothetical protein